MRLLLVLFAVLVVVECKWSYTGEYSFSGKGSETVEMVSNTTHNFCFMSNGQSFYSSKEVCNITTFNNNYFLEANSDQKEFVCGSRCVQNYGGQVSAPAYLTGQGTEQKTLFKYGSSFCYLILGQEWTSQKEACYVTHDDKYWYLHKESSEKSMSCGAQCGYDNGLFSGVKLTDEVVLSGKGSQWRNMQVKVTGGFCFLTKGRQWYHVDEHCQIQAGTSDWELSSTSKQEGFECGARCVIM